MPVQEELKIKVAWKGREADNRGRKASVWQRAWVTCLNRGLHRLADERRIKGESRAEGRGQRAESADGGATKST